MIQQIRSAAVRMKHTEEHMKKIQEGRIELKEDLAGRGTSRRSLDIRRGNSRRSLDISPDLLSATQTNLLEKLMQTEELAIADLNQKMRVSGGWQLRIFGIASSKSGLRGSKLIHPDSHFSMCMLIMSAMLLFYSSIISSYQVGFLWHKDVCDPPFATIYLDMYIYRETCICIVTTNSIFSGFYRISA